MRRTLLAVALLLMASSGVAPALSASGRPHAYVPHPIHLPADAAMHPSANTEWWYFVGHLVGSNGHRFGFEVTMFRFSGLNGLFSVGNIKVLYRADVAITDETAGRFYHSITYEPSEPQTVASTTGLRLSAAGTTIDTVGTLSYAVHGTMAGGAVDLTVTSQRPPMLVHGGFEHWGRGYTYYYSLTYLLATGTLTVAGRRIGVLGTAWMDHQWGKMLGGGVAGWDWMQMQLSDHTDLSVNRERPAALPDGLWAMALLPDNRQQYTPYARITPLGSWRSPTTKTVYPSGWRVRVPALQLDVTVRPTLRDQEMSDTVNVDGYRDSYWEGSCTIVGTRAGHRVTGRGYVELTGYSAGGTTPGPL